jgi:hypothetical protein
VGVDVATMVAIEQLETIVKVKVEVSLHYASFVNPVTITVYVPTSRLLVVDTYIVYEVKEMNEGVV